MSPPSALVNGEVQGPAYKLVADRLRMAIRDAGSSREQLPTESELMRVHGVSRQTVRRAYLDLVAEGIVERIQGKGTFPVRRGRYLRSFGSIDDLMALSEDTELEVVDAISPTVDREVATKLGLQFDDVVYIGYRRLHQELPFCFTKVFLPPAVGEYIGADSFLSRRGARSRATVLAILDKVLPHPISGSKQIITAIPAPAQIGRSIDCEPGEPIMRIERVHFDSEGRPVELCMNYFNPDRYAYTVQLQRHGPLKSRSRADRPS
jgi:DNA-binding GntR family transcriptional regulator